MKDHFAALDIEKQTHIINAACKEFALHGYKLASTNRIVEDAGIGKGMLFYYFESKHNLFLFLLNYCFDVVKKSYKFIDTPDKKGDFFEKYKLTVKNKILMQMENPHVIDFLARVLFNSDESEFSEDIKSILSQIKNMKERVVNYLYMNNDISLFRKDMSAEKIMRYIKWFMDGYSQYVKDTLRIDTVISEVDLMPYWTEFDEFLDDMKKIFI